MRPRPVHASAAGCLVALLSLAGLARAADVDAEVVTTLAGGQINWTQGTVTGKGFAGPDLRAPSVTVSRIGAEKVAREAAATALCRLVRGALAEMLDEAAVSSSPVMPSAVTDHCRARARSGDLKVFSDGAVWIEAQARLESVLAAWQGQPEPAGAPRGTLVITLPRSAAVVPRARIAFADEGGHALEGPAGRIARYARTAAAARKLSKGTVHGLGALRLGSKGELVLAKAEYQKAYQALGADLRQVQVVVVADVAAADKGSRGATR